MQARPPADQVHAYAVRLWQEFPADGSPRPLLYSWRPDLESFDTYEGPGVAAITFRLDATTVPQPPPSMTVKLPDGPTTVPVLTAQAALDQLPSGHESISLDDAVPITSAKFSTDVFVTDRGPRRLPSWIFYSPMLRLPLTLSAVPREVLWPWPSLPWRVDQPEYLPDNYVAIDATGTVLRVVLLRPKAPCSGQPTYRHDPVVTQTPAVVVVGMVPVLVEPQPAVPAGTECDGSAAWTPDVHLIRLASPLGNRPVVNEVGEPLVFHDPPPN